MKKNLKVEKVPCLKRFNKEIIPSKGGADIGIYKL